MRKFAVYSSISTRYSLEWNPLGNDMRFEKFISNILSLRPESQVHHWSGDTNLIYFIYKFQISNYFKKIREK
mgnify:CR=1 FL=1